MVFLIDGKKVRLNPYNMRYSEKIGETVNSAVYLINGKAYKLYKPYGKKELITKDIIKYYKNNNGLNLEKIVDEYNNYIHTVIKNMNYSEFSSEDVEEIVADTFFIIWKNREKLDENKMLSSYIAGIVKNLVRERRKNNKI